MDLPHYYPRLLALELRLRAEGHPDPLRLIAIEHDDDCPTLRTDDGRDCRCEPDLRLMSREEGVLRLSKAGRPQ